MVPFSFKSEMSYSRGMKKRIYTLRPRTVGQRAVDDRHQPMIGTRTQLGERESRDAREGLSSEALREGGSAKRGIGEVPPDT